MYECHAFNSRGESHFGSIFFAGMFPSYFEWEIVESCITSEREGRRVALLGLPYEPTE